MGFGLAAVVQTGRYLPNAPPARRWLASSSYMVYHCV